MAQNQYTNNLVTKTNYLYYVRAACHLNMCYRPLKIRTEGRHARVRELGSIDVYGVFSSLVLSLVCLSAERVSVTVEHFN